MKVIVQIPCYNEARTLPLVVNSIPRSVHGVDRIETLIIDDGSDDGTADIARSLGVDHIVRHTRNKGLAAVFRSGIDACLRLGADIIVNTDGDNQYDQSCIPDLIQPIIDGRADIVIGDRQPQRIAHFSSQKKLLQAVGSFVVRMLTGTGVPDAPSGFRAFSREAALRLNVISGYSYTLETLVQAGAERMAIAYVPVATNPESRPSRLFRSLAGYVKTSAATLLRAYAMYQPLKVFMTLGVIVFLAGMVGVARFLFFYFFLDRGAGNIQSLVLSAALLVVGFQIGLIGMLADLIAANRRLQEETLYRLRRLECEMATRPSSPENGANTDSVEGDRRPSDSESVSYGDHSRNDRHY